MKRIKLTPIVTDRKVFSRYKFIELTGMDTYLEVACLVDELHGKTKEECYPHFIGEEAFVLESELEVSED